MKVVVVAFRSDCGFNSKITLSRSMLNSRRRRWFRRPTAKDDTSLLFAIRARGAEAWLDAHCRN